MPPRISGAAAILPWRSGLLSVLLVGALAGCGDGPWNDPYAGGQDSRVTLYSSFEERPKHLDPARSYSSNEQRFIAQIYEPPLQYHYLRRPYELVPLTTVALPTVTLLGADGQPLAADAAPDDVAFSEYEIRIRPGILYQPHPALARGPDGSLVYETLDPALRERVRTLGDFPVTGTRELTAEDYVYQIKRLAFTPLHSPIAGLMGGYIVGFEAFGKEADAALARLREATGTERPWLDLRSLDMTGVRAADRYTYRIRLKGRYPQFRYWLAMTFFAPMPWEADRFHHLPGLRERNITLDWYPIGTGPFFLAENNPNLRMVLDRNPHFRGEQYPTEGMPEDAAAGLLADAGRPLPVLDRAVYSLEKETIPRWNKFLQGYYDGSGIASDSFDQAVQFNAGGEAALTDAMRARGIGLATSVDTSIFYFGFNMKDPVVGGDSEAARLLRRAIAVALDFEEYVSIFLNGRGLAAQGVLPPGIFGYRDGAGGINPFVYDMVGRPAPPQAARRGQGSAGGGGVPQRHRRGDRQASRAQLRHGGHGPGQQGAARLVPQAVRRAGPAAGHPRHRLQPLPGEDAERDGPVVHLGLERRLPGPRELLLPAVRPPWQGRPRRRERGQLRQPRLRCAVRPHEEHGRRP